MPIRSFWTQAVALWSSASKDLPGADPRLNGQRV